MRTLFVITKNTFKAAIRDRIIHGIAVFAILFILFTLFLGSISLGEDIIIIRSIGLAGIYLFGLVISIFLASSLVFAEIERRTIYLILSKPVSRSVFVAGKFLGLLISIGLILCLMSAVYLGVVWYKGGGFDAPALIAVLLQFFEIAVFIAMVMVFSTFSTPFASTIYAILILYIGHSLSLLIQYVHMQGIVLRGLAYAVYYIAPNLEKFNARNLVIHHLPVTPLVVLSAALYALVYTVVLLWLARLLIAAKDL